MDSDLIVTLVYFLIIFLGILFFIVLYYISNKKEIEVRVIERINAQKAIETLVNNVAKQFRTLIELPLTWKKFKLLTIIQCLSWLMFFLFLSSIAVLIVGGVNQSNTSQFQLLKIGTFIYVLSLNLYFISRQYIYYQKQNLTQLHDPRFIALANTNFNHFERNWANYMQIAVLGLEFLQLLSFPIQDIISSVSTPQGFRDSNGVDPQAIVSIASLLPNISVRFYLIQFWTCMGVVLFTSFTSVILHFYNNRFIPGISLFWVSHLVPLVHVAYLPILVTFINSAACLLGDGGDNSSSVTQLLKCERQVVQPQLYLWLSLLGFTLAYLMLTVFVTSYERKPLEGDIEFKSKGVAFIKNMSRIMSIWLLFN
ncbi:hypothetical protein K502DRAFT_286089 [Neoconidiobolus thromboides FSU 785]|nr:hypothetical protein K502DRAFT_286089 [Neoconidiobolus thromboides FSU 785]